MSNKYGIDETSQLDPGQRSSHYESKELVANNMATQATNPAFGVSPITGKAQPINDQIETSFTTHQQPPVDNHVVAGPVTSQDPHNKGKQNQHRKQLQEDMEESVDDGGDRHKPAVGAVEVEGVITKHIQDVPEKDIQQGQYQERQEDQHIPAQQNMHSPQGPSKIQHHKHKEQKDQFPQGNDPQSHFNQFGGHNENQQNQHLHNRNPASNQHTGGQKGVIALPEVSEIDKCVVRCYTEDQVTGIKQAYSHLIHNLLDQEALSKQNNQLTQKNFEQAIADIRNLQIENKDLSNRLATEMSEKMSNNESSIENVSIKHRPVKVAEEYQEFCTNEWLDLKQFLDVSFPKESEMRKMDLLTQILMHSYEAAVTKHQQITADLNARLIHPMARVSQDGQREQPPEQEKSVKVSDHLTNSIGDHFRIWADETDVKQLVKGIGSTMKFHEYLRKSQQLKQYISSCARFCWKMVLQRPPMTFDVAGINEPFKPDLQEPVWGSADPKNPRSYVAAYVHPALYHNQKLMVKGKVLLGFRE